MISTLQHASIPTMLIDKLKGGVPTDDVFPFSRVTAPCFISDLMTPSDDDNISDRSSLRQIVTSPRLAGSCPSCHVAYDRSAEVKCHPWPQFYFSEATRGVWWTPAAMSGATPASGEMKSVLCAVRWRVSYKENWNSVNLYI